MGRTLKILVIVFSIFFLSGCTTDKNSDTVTMEAPKNFNLKLKGIWQAKGYSILDKNIANNDYVYEVVGSPIKITSSSVTIGGRVYEGVDFKLKYVESDYKLSYEAGLDLSNLGIKGDNIEVYSITNDNTLLCEMIYKGNTKSYIYCQGILFNVTYKKDSKDTVVASKNIITENTIKKSSQGLLLGLKTVCENENGSYQSEKYRTLWISTKAGELQGIKEKQNIIFPRRSGIWELKKHTYTDVTKGIYYEYFKTSAIESVPQDDTATDNYSMLSVGKVVKQQINYVGSDYIATEVNTNEKFNESPVYRVLPVDNISATVGVSISDLYGYQAKNEFDKEYRDTYDKVNNNFKSKLYKEVDYSNFTVVRNNGEWALQGRISPVLIGGEAIDFTLSQKISKPLNNYNTLVIPWKILKGGVSLLGDAFTSSDGSIALVVTNNEIIIYRVEGGKLAKDSLGKIDLKNGEKVIMAQWCENDYINKWASAFLDGSTIIG